MVMYIELNIAKISIENSINPKKKKFNAIKQSQDSQHTEKVGTKEEI